MTFKDKVKVKLAGQNNQLTTCHSFNLQIFDTNIDNKDNLGVLGQGKGQTFQIQTIILLHFIF